VSSPVNEAGSDVSLAGLSGRVGSRVGVGGILVPPSKPDAAVGEIARTAAGLGRADQDWLTRVIVAGSAPLFWNHHSTPAGIHTVSPARTIRAWCSPRKNVTSPSLTVTTSPVAETAGGAAAARRRGLAQFHLQIPAGLLQLVLHRLAVEPRLTGGRDLEFPHRAQHISVFGIPPGQLQHELR
jgi:hypothetical protein